MNTIELIQKIYQSHFKDVYSSLSDIELENQNSDYFGAKFKLSNHIIRFRKGK